MNIDEIRKYYYSSPFHPFTLHLADGRDVAVGHPELMIILESLNLPLTLTLGRRAKG
jgi:hypothetical protein